MSIVIINMETPPDHGGMVAEGLRGALPEADQGLPGMPLARTHLPGGLEDAVVDAEDRDGEILVKMHALLSNTRTQLSRAIEESNQLHNVWSSDEVSITKGFHAPIASWRPPP
jgi:hypothetical protein